jgi:hypothetical protein
VRVEQPAGANPPEERRHVRLGGFEEQRRVERHGRGVAGGLLEVLLDDAEDLAALDNAALIPS